MQAATTIFFDFLKLLQFNDLRQRWQVFTKKSCGRAQKNRPKTDGESRRTARIPGPVLVHPKLEKSRVNFFKRQKKQKVDCASEKKYAQWLH